MARRAETDKVFVDNLCRGVNAMLEHGLQMCDFAESEIANQLLRLSFDAQLIVARLMFLKGPWFRTEACLEYCPRNAECAIAELVNLGLICLPTSEREWVHVLNATLTKPELVTINKPFQLKRNSSMNKPQLIASILKVTTNKNTIFQSTPVRLDKIMERAIGKNLVFRFSHPCLKLCIRAMRTLAAYLPVASAGMENEEDEDAESIEIRGMFRVNPSYSPGFALVMRPASLTDVGFALPQLFESREDLNWLEMSLSLQHVVVRRLRSDTVKFVDGDDLTFVEQCIATSCALHLVQCNNVSQLAAITLQLLMRCPNFPQRAKHLLPYHDAASVLSDVLFMLIEWMEKQKLYVQAVNMLQHLVDSTQPAVVSHRKRATWFQRLVIDITHLKLDALPVCQRAMVEFRSDTQVLWSFFANRALLPANDNAIPVIVVVEATPLLRRSAGSKQLFLRECDSSEVTCTVEEFAIEHYQREAEWQGYHLENYVFKLMFKLLMRQVCFGASPEETNKLCSKLWVFHDQVLDLRTGHFLENRKPEILHRIALIAAWTTEELLEQVKTEYEMMCKEQTISSWLSTAQVQLFAAGMGSVRLSKLCMGFCENYAGLGGGGAPDLILVKCVGNNDYMCKLVEVKSDKDRLSEKQVFWLDFLQTKCGFEVEVFKVKQRTKRTKPSFTAAREDEDDDDFE